ncbi:MAG: GNAT family N-acetyltransferase, partial [Gaiellaceae bacterium]
MWPGLAERLEGRLVVLEPLARSHEPALREAGADPAVWRYMPVDASVDDGAFHTWIETALADSGRVPFAILREGVPVGSSSYLSFLPEHRRLEIGYTWVGRDCWGSGVNT